MVNLNKMKLQHILTAIARGISPAGLAAAGVFILTAIALFIPPYIGMADNGDFYRVMYSNGLYIQQADYDGSYLGYFVKQFGIFQYYNESRSMMLSSQSILIQAAIALNKLVYSNEVFDLRVQGLMLLLLYTTAIYLLVEALTWGVPRKFGMIIAAAAVFLFGDTAYTAYFHSFYGESVVLIATLLLFASWLLMYRNRYNDYVLLAVFLVSGLFLTTSKQQNAPVGILLALMGMALVFIRQEKVYRWAGATVMAMLLVAGAATYLLIPKEYVQINQYHAMTRGVLLHSENPEETLREFGIGKQYAILKDSIYYEKYVPADVNSKQLQEEFYSHYGFGSILAYYATHPDKLGAMLNQAAQHAFTIRPPAMGNYEHAAGKPFAAQTRFFTGYSLLKKAMAPKTIGFIVIWMFLVAGLYLPSLIAALKARNLRQAQRSLLLFTAIGIGLVSILVSIMGAGDADLAKHEFLFTLVFDLVCFTLFADLLARSVFVYPAPPEKLRTSGYTKKAGAAAV